ncbi:transcription-repair coupling factor [Sphingomonas ginkgonis]|uniref:Transcription-repair-coupling factor n=1 Tax=Sphingomonas ginkgonis TaxID=2315330 RepID=A0A3R9Z6T1_9SPHN|nr:transcription-repair coupling factor [Sphingomonas ginkgonis]RST31218.1 transcription-repair coupling factor [Sphingomonas ginkgonis]
MNLDKILKSGEPLTLAGVPTGFLPWLAADLARAAHGTGGGGRAVVIVPDEQAMRALADTAPVFAPEIEVVSFPAWDCLPYDRSSPTLRVMAERLSALHQLQAKRTGPQLLVATANAATQRLLTPFRIRQLTRRLAPGERIDRDQLVKLLTANGYQRVESVHDAGEYAVRGSLVDLFPAGESMGVRLDFFGDEVETMRRFDPADQRTTGPAEAFTLMPASEALLDEESIKRFRARYRETFGANATGDPLYQAISDGRRLAGMEHWLPLFEEKLATLFDHLGDGDLIVRDGGTDGALTSRFESIQDYFQNRERAMVAEPGSYRPLAPQALYFAKKEWDQTVADRPIHLASAFPEPEGPRTIDFGVTAARDFAPERAQNENVYEAVAEHVAKLRKGKHKIVLASYSGGARERLAGLLKDHGLTSLRAVDGWQEALGVANSAALLVLPLEHGFTTPDVAVLTEQDMLGDRLVRRRKRRKSADAFLSELATLTPGDLVVHADHGIGRYEGLAQVKVGNAPHDCVALEYAGGNKLYVPVENIDVLTRYGAENEGVQLDRLGGEAWQRRKARMKERIREIAGELIQTAALRATRAGAVAEADSTYPAFVDRFPYEETEDQDRAIGDVLEDLGAGRPMDRLVCGDVGFGKTEVALRAAFVAAMAGYQVALVCPTTLLARQHYANFVERFKGFPIEVGRLSRLVSSTEAKKTKDLLEAGKVDILIGTHAILAKGIKFRKLGLVIVDEEQRFGVTHKERLKALKNDVHVLTLTATPIPRTLQMAMSGLRELSVIQTPPVDRLAVRTYVTPWDPIVVREALLREHYRGGQSYFVVPRVADLPDIEEWLREEVPEVKAIAAHGQMAAGEVEERMSAFYDRKYDVLLSTTIVESGLDIPSANTLVVHRADRFGLAQLYQLRGRVGRSKTRAYAYLTTPPDRQITETAEKRLQVLANLDSLGAGFQLASHDLDIRGAGNLLGDEQSGHIKEVGFELYQSMLEEAILAVKSGHADTPKEEFSPQINVEAPVMIPEAYVPDLDLRMGLYRRLGELEDRQQVEEFAAELIDRFGPLPGDTENLLSIVETKINCRKACIAKLDVGAKGAVVTFAPSGFPDVPGLLGYVDRLKGAAKLRPDQKLVVSRDWGNAKSRLDGALQISRGLARVVAAGEKAKVLEPA